MRELLTWLILLLPLFAAVAITLFTRRNRALSAGLSIGAISLSFVFSLAVFVRTAPLRESIEFTASWLQAGDLRVDFGLRLDPLSLLMLLIVTGVGGAIHIYSYGYMREDPGLSRYFAKLSLFTFSMLGIVLSNNFLQLYIFWELVGLSSYLLIGFWFERPSAADASKKAFLTNRLGDFGFMLGILLVWGILGTLNFGELQQKLATNPGALGAMATLAGILIFCGAVGKSAQFPLHVWLPDAMEGPTPVSALIHAATMVAAGVYMLCRVFFILSATPAWPESILEHANFLRGVSALDVVAWIGGITALLAALIAVQQNDIKRILAYSTLSQLGYMVMAVGLGGPTPAMYHLTTHAFFKALLFLGAGAVIQALHHEQNIWNMGGLARRMPVTFWTFLVATLALCGMPPFSGFFSKDEILAAAATHNTALLVLAVGVALLTTFYMFRLVFVAFLGQPRTESATHAREVPAVMAMPLLALAIPAALAGFWGIDHFYARQFGGHEAGAATSWFDHVFEPFGEAPLAGIAGLASIMFGFYAARELYRNAAQDALPEKLGRFARLLRNRFYFDELYAALIAGTQEVLARLADAFDRWIIAGLFVRGIHGTTELTGRFLRLLQTGNLQTYAFLLVAGVALILFFTLARH